MVPPDAAGKDSSGLPPEPKRRGSYQSPEMPDGSSADALASLAEYVPLPEARVGTWSNHGIKPGIGGRAAAKINQDLGQITYPLCGDRQMLLLCVYDGHGTNGELVSEFAMLKVPDLLEEQPERLYSDTEALLVEAFEATDKSLRESPIASAVSGSTGVLVLLNKDKIWTANVGDSRAVLGRRNGVGKSLKAIPLTRDQKPDDPFEQQRILKCGGYVSPESAQHGPARVWLRMGEGPGLAMARSIGDHMCAHVGVIATPEIKSFDLHADDALIVLASDGVWEFISDKEAIDIVSSHTTATRGCTALINEATLRWRKEEGNYRDDITCIVVILPILPDPNGQAPAAAEPEAADIAVMTNGYSQEALRDDGEVPAHADGDGNFQQRRLTLAREPTDQELQALIAAHPETETAE